MAPAQEQLSEHDRSSRATFVSQTLEMMVLSRDTNTLPPIQLSRIAS